MAQVEVTFAVNKLLDLLAEEPTLLMGIQEEAKRIADELRFMNYFLDKLDPQEVNSDFIIKAMSTRLRDIAFDMEAALDNFRLRMSQNCVRGYFLLFRRLGTWIHNVRAQHRIYSDIHRIQSNLEVVIEQQRRYLITHNTLEPPLSFSTVPKPMASLGDALQLDESNMVGIENPKRHIIKSLLQGESERQVVSVVGMGGLGKTTLVKMVYSDVDVKMHFKFRAWITLSQYSNTEYFLKEIIRQLFPEDKKPYPGLEVQYMDCDELSSVTAQFLVGRRYLIVLDDIWHIQQWKALEQALPRNNCGSRVLLTTRNSDLAKMCSEAFLYNIYVLNLLSLEESWALFCKRTFKGNSCPPNLREVSQKILRKCEGLPLAIVAVSGILTTKENRIDEWEKVYRSLGSILEEDDRLMSIARILSLSYNDLPYHLKSCLLYISIFPEGTPLNCTRLIRLWIAEGFVTQRQGLTLEEVAEKYLQELISRNLVLVVETYSDGRIKSCSIHDLVREVMFSKIKEQNFAEIVKEPAMMYPEKIHRLAAYNVMPSLQKRRSSSRLHSLLLFWAGDALCQPPIWNYFFRRLRLLTVLDMQGAPIDEFPEKVTGLFLLKYLSLRNTKVESVPRSISNLQILETLDLKHARVTELPIEILKLQKLHHLLVYRYNLEFDNVKVFKYGFKSLAQVGSLKSLQKLCFVEANSILVAELGKLIQLRRLGIIKLNREDGETFCSSIENLIKLHALSVTSTNADEIIDMEHIRQPPPLLQRLYLSGRLVKIPSWIPLADSLVKVILRWSRLSDDPLKHFQNLPNLASLALIGAYDGEQMCFQANGFKKLKLLGVTKMESLSAIEIERGAIPLLERLIIQSCESLRRLPIGIEYLSEMKVLELHKMPKEFLKTLQPDEEHGDYHKIQFVPEVYFTYWNDGNWETIHVGHEPTNLSVQREPYVYKY